MITFCPISPASSLFERFGNLQIDDFMQTLLSRCQPHAEREREREREREKEREREREREREGQVMQLYVVAILQNKITIAYQSFCMCEERVT
jgi:hypothetical protein